MNLNDTVILSTIIQGVQAKRMFVLYDMEANKATRGYLRRFYRHGEMPGEDWPRDSDDVLDLAIEVEYDKTLSRGFLSVLDVLNLARAHEFFVE